MDEPRITLLWSGPGDPDLLSVRAQRRLAESHLVAHDPGVPERILELAPAGASRHRVGSPPPAGLAKVLVRAVRAAWNVVLVSSAEPFATGWSTGLLRRLERAGVVFEAIPSLPRAFAAIAAAGIPAAAREAVPDVTAFLLRGHRGRVPGLMATTVTGAELVELADALSHQGVPMRTPAVVVRRPLTARQEVQRADVGRLACAARSPEEVLEVVMGKHAAPSPCWDAFGRLPLLGRRVVVTRAARQADALVGLLEAQGADVLCLPTLAIEPPRDPKPLDRALLRLSEYAWLVFTSANGVRRFFARLDERGEDVRAVGHLKLAAIGPGTAEALAEWRLRPDVVPDEFVAESLAAALVRAGVRGQRILLPRAREARELLPALLAKAGARLDVVEAYRAVPVRRTRAAMRAAVEHADALTFASAQTALNFAAGAGPALVRALRRSAVIASIGPITSTALREAGLPPTTEARAYTIPGLAEVVVEAVRDRAANGAGVIPGRPERTRAQRPRPKARP